MNISKEQSAKLGRYFINADPFLWGVLKAKNKKGRLKELKQMGFWTYIRKEAIPSIVRSTGIYWLSWVLQVFWTLSLYPELKKGLGRKRCGISETVGSKGKLRISITW